MFRQTIIITCFLLPLAFFDASVAQSPPSTVDWGAPTVSLASDNMPEEKREELQKSESTYYARPVALDRIAASRRAVGLEPKGAVETDRAAIGSLKDGDDEGRPILKPDDTVYISYRPDAPPPTAESDEIAVNFGRRTLQDLADRDRGIVRDKAGNVVGQTLAEAPARMSKNTVLPWEGDAIIEASDGEFVYVAMAEVPYDDADTTVRRRILQRNAILEADVYARVRLAQMLQPVTIVRLLAGAGRVTEATSNEELREMLELYQVMETEVEARIEAAYVLNVELIDKPLRLARVSICSRPNVTAAIKARGVEGQHAVASRSLQEGIEFVLNKIRQGVVLQRGAAYVAPGDGIPDGYFAVVGWGSEVVALEDDHPRIATAVDLARRIAVQESQVALVRALSGERIGALDRSQRAKERGREIEPPSVAEIYETRSKLPAEIDPGEPEFRRLDRGTAPESAVDEPVAATTLVDSAYRRVAKTVTEGVLPAGTINKWFVEDGWVYAVCVKVFEADKN